MPWGREGERREEEEKMKASTSQSPQPKQPYDLLHLSFLKAEGKLTSSKDRTEVDLQG